MKRLLVCALLISCSLLTFGQRTIDENGKSSFMDRVYVGGGLGFSGGNNPYYGRYTHVGLYPILGYMVTNQFSVGSTITYQYYNYPDVGQSVTQYGISPFVRYNLGQMFLYSEYMILNSPTYDPNTPRKIYNRLLMGVGFRQPIGARGAINAMALYDVLYNPADRVFNSPWVFRVFLSF